MALQELACNQGQRCRGTEGKLCAERDIHPYLDGEEACRAHPLAGVANDVCVVHGVQCGQFTAVGGHRRPHVEAELGVDADVSVAEVAVGGKAVEVVLELCTIEN